MHVEDFSSGYYKLSMQVEPYTDGPMCSCNLFDFIQREYYGSVESKPIFRLDMDGSPYFTASCENSIPQNVIGLPEHWFDEPIAERTYHETPVYLLKPDDAHLMDNAMNVDQSAEDVIADLDDDLDLRDSEFRQE